MSLRTLENEYAYILDEAVFLKGYLGMPDRQIGIVKNTPQEAFDYFINRFDIASNKVKQLFEEIDAAQNKGSFLTKLIQLKKRLLVFDGIGNFIPLLEQLDHKEVVLKELIGGNQKNNLEMKLGFLTEAKEIAATEDYKNGALLLQELKTKWIRTGPVTNDKSEDIEAELVAIYDDFYNRRKDYYEKLNAEIDGNIAKAHELIDLAYGLRRQPTIDEGFAELKRLQQEYRNLGNIPPKKQKDLARTFKKVTTNYYEYYCREKGIDVVKKVDPRIKMQQDMVAEVEKLSQSTDIFAAADRTKVLLNDWKNVKVPMDKADKSLADKFRNACDKIFELSYLMKVISRKYPAFAYMSDIDAEVTKFREMENIVKRAKFDITTLEEEIAGMGGVANVDRAIQSNFMTQKRKLQMKVVILEELRAKIQG
jgi:hypothetical protein